MFPCASGHRYPWIQWLSAGWGGVIVRLVKTVWAALYSELASSARYRASYRFVWRRWRLIGLEPKQTRRSVHRPPGGWARSEEHTSELQSLMRISYAVFCLKKKKSNNIVM